MPALIFSLLLSSVIAAAAQQRYANISLGSSLTPTSNPSSWLSPSGLYAFRFFPVNNNTYYAVGIFFNADKTVVWTANRGNHPTLPNKIAMLLTHEGRLVLQKKEGQDINVVNPAEQISFGSMLNNGNFVLYDSQLRIIWQSFDYPTDTLLPGQRLWPGQELFSSASETDPSRGRFRLKMQHDGNLVQYPVNTPDERLYAYYSSDTDQTGDEVSLNLRGDGHLCLLNGSSLLTSISMGGYTTKGGLYLMRIDVDGIFRVYCRLPDRERNWTAR